ncbi:hypothetical protein [Mycobacterium sp. NPDC050853]|uniref:hypothetical protein n=1 Tax=Mycobacterium sp. NPDC050853 TaxID=3155160 RepID=UPI0033EE3B9E
MPVGVEVVVEDGFATIDFVDKALRGPGLAKLLEVGTPPDAIEKLTRSGPRPVYVVPEGNAREAGLLDEADEPVFANGGLITPGSASSGDSVLVQLDPGYVVPGDGIPKQGIEAPTDGTFTELITQDTGGPYEILPEIVNPDGTTQLEPIAAVTEPAAQAWPDGEPELDWKRPDLDAYAASKGLDTLELPNKAAVLDAIAEAGK